jgi:hypothetical protein
MIDPSKVFDGARCSENIKNIYHVIMPHPGSGELSKIGKYTLYGSIFLRKKKYQYLVALGCSNSSDRPQIYLITLTFFVSSMPLGALVILQINCCSCEMLVETEKHIIKRQPLVVTLIAMIDVHILFFLFRSS